MKEITVEEKIKIMAMAVHRSEMEEEKRSPEDIYNSFLDEIKKKVRQDN